MLAIGDGWRAFALKSARMIRKREAFDPAALASQLGALADQEAAFFARLRRVVA